MGSYIPTTWVDDSTPALQAQNLNKLESGVENAHDKIDAIAVGESPQGQFQPTAGTPYPTPTAFNQSWYIGGLAYGVGFTYTSGNLNGTTVNNLDKIIYTTSGWKWVNSGLDNVSVLTGFKNAIVNGDFSINQYDDIDTVPVAMVNGNYQIDRHQSYTSAVGATLQRFKDTLFNGVYTNTVKCVATTTESARFGLFQPLENFYKGQTKTFSVPVKSNSANARLIIYDGDAIHSSDPHSGGGAKELLQITATISTSATFLRCYVAIVSATLGNVSITSGDYIEFTMEQLEDGSVATDYEQKLIGLELNLCQRYLPYRSEIGSTFTYHGRGLALNATTAYIYIPTKTDARIKPTSITFSGNLALGDGVTLFPITGLTIDATKTTSKNIVLNATVASGLTATNSYELLSNNEATAYIKISTEL